MNKETCGDDRKYAVDKKRARIKLGSIPLFCTPLVVYYICKML